MITLRSRPLIIYHVYSAVNDSLITANADLDTPDAVLERLDNSHIVI